MPKNHNQIFRPFPQTKTFNTERIDRQKKIELNTAKHEDKFQKWVDYAKEFGVVNAKFSIAQAMMEMSDKELNDIYNIKAKHIKSKYNGVIRHKTIVMLIILCCVISAADCKPIPTTAQQNTARSTTTVARQNNTNRGSQAYKDYHFVGNLAGQNVHNNTFTGQQNNLNIVCGNQTNNNTNTAKFNGATLEFFKNNLGNSAVPNINTVHIFELGQNSTLIHQDIKLLNDIIGGTISPEAISDEVFARLNNQEYIGLLLKIADHKQIKFDKHGNLPINIGNATFKNNVTKNDNLVKNSKNNLVKTLETLQTITNGGIIFDKDQDLNTININFIDSDKQVLYKGKNVTYYGHMDIKDVAITYNLHNNATHSSNFEMHEILHYLDFHHNFNTKINTLQDCTITSEPWGPEYECNSIMSYCHEDFNTINGATIAYILAPKNNIIQKIPEPQANALQNIYNKYEDALHRGLTFFDIMDIQKKYAKPPFDEELINVVKNHDLTKYLLFKRLEDGVLQYEGTGDKINIMNCFKYYKDGYTYPIDPNDFTKKIDHLKNGSPTDKEKYEKIQKIKNAASDAYKKCVEEDHNKQEEAQKNNSFSYFEPNTLCDHLKLNNKGPIKQYKPGPVVVNKLAGHVKSKELPVTKKEKAESNFTFRDGAKATAGAVGVAALFTAVALCLVCKKRKCRCNNKQNNRRASFSGTPTELETIVRTI